jgi:hypothetical protein
MNKPHNNGYKVIALVMAVVLIVSGLAACGVDNKPTSQPATTPTTATSESFSPASIQKISTTATVPPEWGTRWLQGIPCRPPCWEGVTPGKTSPEEAVNILKQSPLIGTVELSAVTKGDKNGFVSWNWKTPATNMLKGGPEDGLLRYNLAPTPALIYGIETGLSGYRLGEIIQAFGNPSHIIATSEPKASQGYQTFYTLYVVYLDNGFILKAEYPQKPALDENVILGNLEFFKADIEGFEAIQAPSKELLVGWAGFKDFKYYCRALYVSTGKAGECAYK